jgi:chromosome segregation ATPase
MSLLSTLALLVLPLYRPEGRVAEVEEENAALREKVSELEKEVAAGKRREETAERGYLNTLHRLANTQHELAYWRESYHRAMSGPQMLGQAQQAQQQLYAQAGAQALARQQFYQQAQAAQGMLGAQGLEQWGEFCNCIPDRNEVFRRTGAAGPIAQ